MHRSTDHAPTPRAPAARAGRALLTALAVTLGVIVALNVAFIAYAAYVSLWDLLSPGRGATHPLQLGVFGVIIVAAGAAALRTLMRPVPRAVVLAVPLGFVYAAIGIGLHRHLAAVIGAGVLVFAAVLVGLRRGAEPWPVWFSVCLVSAVMLAITVTGTDI